MKTKLFLISLLLLFINTSFAQNEQKEVVIDVAEQDPEYPGGEEAMNKFIASNFKYPEEARKLGEQGTVYVQFVVYKDGTLRDVHIIKGVSESIDAEAIRVIESMPNWKPGMQDGKKVNVRFIIPIKVSLEVGKKKKKRWWKRKR